MTEILFDEDPIRYVRWRGRCAVGVGEGFNHIKLLNQLTGERLDVFDAKTFANSQEEGSIDAGFFNKKGEYFEVGGISRSLCFPPENMSREEYVELKRETARLMNERENTSIYRVDLD